MTDANTFQDQTAGAWSRAAASYSHTGPDFFQEFGQALVDFAQVPQGAKALDVATGRGAVLFAAARQVGPRGEVIGVDYADGMVHETQAEIKTNNLKNASVRQMNAEALEFPDQAFDVVFCSFAIFFFPHPDRALREFQRVLKPGGKVAISTWGADDSRWVWLAGLRKQFSPPQQSQSTAPSFDKVETLVHVLEAAGFQDIETQEQAKEVYFKNPEEWWSTQWSYGARLFLERVPADRLEQGRNFAFQKLVEMQKPQGIPLLYTALFARGKNV